MLSPSDIRPAVEAVLIAADRSLTTYEILNRLPDNLLQQIISERGMPGLGSGNSYSAASLVTDSVEGLLPSLAAPYRVYEHRQAVFTVAGQEIRPGNNAIALYRLNPLVAVNPHSSNDETKPVTMGVVLPPIRTSVAASSSTHFSPLPTHQKWFEKPRMLVLWFFLFWPVFLVGMHYNGKAAIAKGRTPWYEESAWLIASMLFFPLFFVGLFSNQKILPKWKWTAVGTWLLFCTVFSFTDDLTKSYLDTDAGQSASDSTYPAAVVEVLPSQNQEIDTEEPTKPSADTMIKSETVWQERITAEKDYLNQMVELMGTWGAAYQKLGGMLSQYGNSPELLQDESWRAGFVVAMVTAQLASKQIQSIQNVPNNAKQHHRLWIKAAQEGDMGLALLVRGIDKQRVDLITQGLPHFRRGVDLSNEANSELENMKQRTLDESQNH